MSRFIDTARFPTVETASKDKNVYNFNGSDYLVSVFLDNRFDIYEVPMDKLVSIQIVDDMLGFNHTGTLKYKSLDFTTAKTFNAIVSKVAGDACKQAVVGDDAPFHFNGTGSEMVHIKLQRIRATKDKSNVEKKDDIIMNTYVVTDVVDSGNSFDHKQYTLEMVGIERHILEQYKLKDFVAGNSSRNMDNDTLSKLDEHPYGKGYGDKLTYRADKTGEAIYHIMLLAYDRWSTETKCVVPFTDLLPPIRTENSDNRQLSGEGTKDSNGRPIKTTLLNLLSRAGTGGNTHAINYKIDVFDQTDQNIETTQHSSFGTQYPRTKTPTDFWDFGAEDSCLFTHFGKDVSAWEVVSTYLNMHTSSVLSTSSSQAGVNFNTHDPCILKMERPVMGGVRRGLVSLRPLSSYFKMAYHGNFVSEGMMGNFKFNVVDNTGTNFDIIPRLLQPILCDDSKSPTKSIEDFVFEPASPADAAKFFRTHTTDYTKGDFVTTNKIDGDFDNVKQYIGINYVKPIYGKKLRTGAKWGDVVNIADSGLSNSPSNFIHNTYQNSPSISAQLAQGRNKAIFTFVFMNDSLSFTTDGSINRKSGEVFTAMPTVGVDPNDKILNRMNGSYLCSGITHNFEFEGSKYTNDIVGVRFFK